MKQGILIAFGTTLTLSSAYAANPASQLYVDTAVALLQHEIDTLPVLPPGGAAGAFLIKASDANFDVKWSSNTIQNTYQIGDVYPIGCTTHCGTVVSVFLTTTVSGSTTTVTQNGLAVYNSDLTPGPFTQANAAITCGLIGTAAWTLPTMAQLSNAYANRYLINPNDSNGGFVNSDAAGGAAFYWTSSQPNGNPSNGWALDFASATMNSVPVSNMYNARCVVQFSILVS